MATYNRNKEINTDSIALVQIAQKQKQREQKLAREIAEFEREEKIETIKDNLKVTLLPVAIVVIGYGMIHLGAYICLWLGGLM
jgi:hypothetical protein